MLQIVSESNNSGCNPDINPYVVYEGIRVIVILVRLNLLVPVLLLMISLPCKKQKKVLSSKNRPFKSQIDFKSFKFRD